MNDTLVKWTVLFNRPPCQTSLYAGLKLEPNLGSAYTFSVNESLSSQVIASVYHYEQSHQF